MALTLQVDSPLGASAVAGAPASVHRGGAFPKDGSSFAAQQSPGMQRPQDRFLDAVDNSNSPFVHNFKHVRHWQVSNHAIKTSAHACPTYLCQTPPPPLFPCPPRVSRDQLSSLHIGRWVIMLLMLLIVQARLQSVCADMAVYHACNNSHDARRDWSACS